MDGVEIARGFRVGGDLLLAERDGTRAQVTPET
jgi:hypothetical protein